MGIQVGTRPRPSVDTWRIATLLVLGLGCEHDSAALAPPPVQLARAAVGHGDVGSAIYRIELSVDQAPKPGEQLAASVTVTALEDASSTRVALRLPELHVSRDPRFMATGLTPVYEQIPPVAEWTLPMSRGQSATFSTSVEVPRAGYYRISATVLHSRALGNPAVQTFAVHEKWVLVDTIGAIVTDDFEVQRVPRDHFPAPGVFRLNAGGLSYGEVDSVAEGRVTYESANASAAQLAPMVFRHTYYSTDGYYGHIRGARAQYSGAIAGVTFTDVGGAYSIPCPPNPGITSVNLRAWNDTINLRRQTPAGSDTLVKFTTTRASCGLTTELYMTTDNAMPTLWENFELTARYSRLHFGRGRPQLTVVKVAAGQGPAYLDLGGNVIFPEFWVGGPSGIEVSAHEFGHALHRAEIGEAAFTTIPACVNRGAYHLPTQLACAWVEGVAQYHAAITRPDFITVENDDSYGDYIERNYFYGWYGNLDGSLLEHAVGAFLNDLTDAPQDRLDDDPMSYPGSYVLDLIKSCKAYNPGGGPPIAAQGVDHFVYCLEEQMDPAVLASSTYFATRSPDPTGFDFAAVRPSTWNHATIRLWWRRNLYGEGW